MTPLRAMFLLSLSAIVASAAHATTANDGHDNKTPANETPLWASAPLPTLTGESLLGLDDPKPLTDWAPASLSTIGEPMGLLSEPGDGLTAKPMPAGPGSAQLVLWALTSLGAWRVTRLDFRMPTNQALPEWYHDGGPWQIGHTHAIDMTFSLAALPIRPLEFPLETSGRPLRMQTGPRVTLLSTDASPVWIPRGPPLFPSC